MKWTAKGTELAHAGHNLNILVSAGAGSAPGAAEKLAAQLADLLNGSEEVDYLTTAGQYGNNPKKPDGAGWRLLHTTAAEARQVQWTWERPRRLAG